MRPFRFRSTLLCFALAAAAQGDAFAASVSNVRITEQGGQYSITYDLEADAPTPVLLMGSDDGGKRFDIKMEFATGDVGDQVPSGKGKKILWDAGRDFPKGTGNMDLVVDVILGYRSSSLQEVKATRTIEPVRTDADVKQDLLAEQEKTRGFIEKRKEELEDLQQEERKARAEVAQYERPPLSQGKTREERERAADRYERDKKSAFSKLDDILKKQDLVRSRLRQLEKDLKQLAAERRQ